ncbi:MAG TPA: thioesterase family protein [Acidimicrobiia bacterium]|nr:thioesterase family protein [Acidimicrobiia bacterium]
MPAATLQPGLRHRFTYPVPPSKTVPNLYPEADDFTAMPEVFATGFMVGLIEWTCIQMVNQHIDWPAEMTLGVHIDVSHEAATPPGLEVTTTVELTKVDGRLLEFAVEAHDGVDTISRGTHRRAIVDAAKFKARAAAKVPGTPS